MVTERMQRARRRRTAHRTRSACPTTGACDGRVRGDCGQRADRVRRRSQRQHPGDQGADRRHRRRAAAARRRTARALHEAVSDAMLDRIEEAHALDEDDAARRRSAACRSRRRWSRRDERRIEPKRRVGFFTDTTVCIGCKACEVACKQWNQLPDDGFVFTGLSYDNTAHLGASTWRHVAFVEREEPLESQTTGARRLLVALSVRRLQALPARRLPRGLPDRRDHPHRVRHRLRAARHVQRLRLLRGRAARSASSIAARTTGAPGSARSATTA